MHLNFGWRFSPNFRQEYIRNDFKDNVFRIVDIPHTPDDIPSFDDAPARGASEEKKAPRIFCYRKNFILRPEMKKKRLLLHFEGVMGCAAVFINSKPVYVHRGGFTPFCCEITDSVSPYINNGDNLITVAVDCTEREDTYPFGDMTSPRYHGGIYREVWLEAVDSVYVSQARVKTTMDKENWVLDIAGELSDPESTELRIYVDSGGNRLFGKYLLVENAAFSYRLPITAGIEPWTLDKPRLYDLLITASSGDEYRLRFGFREAEFRQDGFYLNGEKIRLVGLERCQNYSRIGPALPKSAQREDVMLLKRLGCNRVRTGQTPPSPAFLDACDELGLLVFEEIPGRGGVYGQAGDGEGRSVNADRRENALQTARELVQRDRHHPSVVLWGTRPEFTPEDDDLYLSTYRAAMEYDGSRQTTGVRTVSELRGSPYSESTTEDVFSVNDFSCTGLGGYGLEKKKYVLKTRQPYLIAGHTGMKFPAGSGAGEKVLEEQALRHAMAMDAAFGESECCGIIGKCLSDYDCLDRMGGSDGMCACGVTDSMRVMKPAAYFYESQTDDHPVLELCSSLYSADRPGPVEDEPFGVWCFTNCDRVELYRDGKFTASFLPDRKRFPNLPHPPVFIDDFLGNLLVSEEHIEPKEAALIKPALVSLLRGGELPSESRFRAACAQAKNRYTPARMGELYNKYFARRFGGAELRFDGVIQGKVQASIVSAPVTTTGLRVRCGREKLMSAVTYDCTRIELVAVDGSGRRLYGCRDAVSVTCEGSVDVMGPKLFSLEAGACAFYVRTKGGKGPASVKIVTGTLGTYTVALYVERTR